MRCSQFNQLYKKLNSQLSPHDASKQLSLSDFAGDPLGKSHKWRDTPDQFHKCRCNDAFFDGINSLLIQLHLRTLIVKCNKKMFDL